MTTSPQPIERLASELHYSHLKPLGFTKRGKVFLRRLPQYTELVQVEASSHNISPGPWRFGVTIGAHFDDIKPPPRSQATRGRAHAVGDIRGLVPNLPHKFEVNLEDVQTQAKELANLIRCALSRLPEFADAARANASEGRMTLIPLQKWDPQYRKANPSDAHGA